MAVFEMVSRWKVSSRAGNFIYLVLKVYGRIEVWNLRIDRLADDFPLAGVKKGSHFWHCLLVSCALVSWT